MLRLYCNGQVDLDVAACASLYIGDLTPLFPWVSSLGFHVGVVEPAVCFSWALGCLFQVAVWGVLALGWVSGYPLVLFPPLLGRSRGL